MNKLYKFDIRGLGIITTTLIFKNSFIGVYLKQNIPTTSNSRLIYNGWVETNPLGRYINHNRIPNCYIEKVGDSLKLYAKESIEPYTELTINYFTVVNLIDIPKSLYDTLGIYDYDYSEQEIDKIVNLI